MPRLPAIILASLTIANSVFAGGYIDLIPVGNFETPVVHPHMTLPESETRGAPESPRSSDPRCKLVGTNWAWFSDHVATSVTYVVQARPERQYEIGTGVSMFGKPRGRTYQKKGKTKVTAYGAGAIHVRVSDGGSPMSVCVVQGDLSTITFVDMEF